MVLFMLDLVLQGHPLGPYSSQRMSNSPSFSILFGLKLFRSDLSILFHSVIDVFKFESD